MRTKCFFIVSIVICLFVMFGCAMFHRSVYLPESGYKTKVITQWNSLGNYNVDGKTYVLIPANDSISASDLNFSGFAHLIEKSLVYSGAVRAKEGENVDMRILMEYKTFANSYIEEISPNSHGVPLANSGYMSPTYAYKASMGIITRRTEYDHYVNIYAFDNKNIEATDTLWQINAFTLGTPEQLHEVMPFIAYSLRNEYGKSRCETKTEELFDVDYMFRLYYKNFLHQPNVVEFPTCENWNINFEIAFVAKYTDETFVCIKKTSGVKGYYSFGPLVYLEVNGNKYKGSLVDSDYTLGDKIWNEFGTRFFVFKFPVNVLQVETISVYDENKHGEVGLRWSNVCIE